MAKDLVQVQTTVNVISRTRPGFNTGGVGNYLVRVAAMGILRHRAKFDSDRGFAYRRATKFLKRVAEFVPAACEYNADAPAELTARAG